MPPPLPVLIDALADIVRWERHRIEFSREQALRGGCMPPPDEAFAGWQQRLERLEALLELTRGLVPHQAQVAALIDGQANRDRAEPTMWS